MWGRGVADGMDGGDEATWLHRSWSRGSRGRNEQVVVARMQHCAGSLVVDGGMMCSQAGNEGRITRHWLDVL